MMGVQLLLCGLNNEQTPTVGELSKDNPIIRVKWLKCLRCIEVRHKSNQCPKRVDIQVNLSENQEAGFNKNLSNFEGEDHVDACDPNVLDKEGIKGDVFGEALVTELPHGLVISPIFNVADIYPFHGDTHAELGDAGVETSVAGQLDCGKSWLSEEEFMETDAEICQVQKKKFVRSLSFGHSITHTIVAVYALWKVPGLLPAFVLKGGEVSGFIIGGADLMFPGINIPADGLPSFLAGEPWAVKVPGNPAPIAVGTTCISSTQAIKAGLRGKALRITHTYRDSLWESVETRHVPNAGFLEDVVFGDPSLIPLCQPSDSLTNDASVNQENSGSNKEEGKALDTTDGDTNVDSTSTTHPNSETDTSGLVLSDMGDLKVTENASVYETNAENQQTLSMAEVDALLHKCLLQALHTTVKDKDLPLPGSTLWSGHVLPCRPSGIILDIKKSSHKKLSKWLQSESSAGMFDPDVRDHAVVVDIVEDLGSYSVMRISVKEDKHKKEVVLFAVNRSHPEYASFKPEKLRAEKKEQPMDHAVNEGRLHTKLEVAEKYKPSVHVNPIFASVGADTQKLYSASEATDIVFRYIEKENMVKATDKSVVVLDAILCDALFKGAIKKGSSYPTEIHKKDLGPTFIHRMQAHHVVTRGNESIVRKGALKTIQIMTERRQGNKKVTKLSGMESFLIHAEALASELQKKFACSTTVAELPGKKGLEVLVQGGVIDDLAKHLVEHYGVPKRYIEVLDKTKK
ncbi:hypothetical protein RJ640_013462 [Escallonia rubra]|uniref:SUI1 domain-containing protein n=1 Tax=Escallonia rubra TaxID=112253 RepID=A0AA88QQK9_9ASTE|nr:hypothetical protein RJ640_013462 [Escallonia rubra]